jgi:hypothetical protein
MQIGIDSLVEISLDPADGSASNYPDSETSCYGDLGGTDYPFSAAAN